MKMKYRLLGTALLPAIILLGFLIKFLIQDYETIQRMDNIKKFNELSSRLGSFLQIFMESKLPEEQPDEKDKMAKIELNSSFHKLKSYYETIKVNVDNEVLKNDFEKILIEAENLTRQEEAHNQLDPQIIQSYNELLTEVTNLIVIIARYSVEVETSRALYAYVALLHQQASAWNERIFVYEMVKNKKAPPQQLLKLAGFIDEQKAYFLTFSEFSTLQEDSIYQGIVKDSASEIIDDIRTSILQGTFNGIEPRHWWEAKTKLISQLSEISNKILERNTEFSIQLKSERLKSLIFDLLSIAGVFLLTIFLTIINLRKLTQRLQDQTDALATSNQEILASISSASSSSAETAAAVTETTTTVEELKQTAQIAAEKAKNVASVSEEARQTLHENEKTIDDSIESMRRIQEGMAVISDSIIKLSNHGKMIGDIIESVNDLAEQSHLLAVNAAIEAAKAGEQGKGFGVVATEVRRLAEQSKSATVQVRNILRDIQNSTGTAVMATEQGAKAVASGTTQSKQTVEALRNLSHEITKVSDAASQIALSSAQQLIGVEQVTIAMGNINESSNLLVDTMRHIEDGVQSSNKVSQNLKNLVQEYKL